MLEQDLDASVRGHEPLREPAHVLTHEQQKFMVDRQQPSGQTLEFGDRLG